jgi:porphobilinogen synthase
MQLFHRPRRLRRTDWSRRLVQENTLSSNDFIYPVFLLEGKGREEAVKSMPGVSRVSLDLLLPIAQECVQLGIPVMALFPVIGNDLKTTDGKEAFNPNGLIPLAVKELKKQFPNLGIMTDIALDPYTSHGQDGLIDDEGYVINDVTVDALVKQALIHAQAGVDIVAPSDMMDGRIAAIRDALEAHGFVHTQSWPTLQNTHLLFMVHSETQLAQQAISVKVIKKLIKWIRPTLMKLSVRFL